MLKKLFSIMLILLCTVGVCYAKDMQVCPAITLNVPEDCPDYREFRPFPPSILEVNEALQVIFVVQEGQRGSNEFVLVIVVIQADPDAAFVLAISHSVVDMKDPGKSITRIFADKDWIEKGEPSNKLTEVNDLPKDPKFYKSLNKKKYPIKKVL